MFSERSWNERKPEDTMRNASFNSGIRHATGPHFFSARADHNG